MNHKILAATSDSLVFFVDPSWRREMQHIPLLYPFWGNCLDKRHQPFHHALFERYSFDTTRYSITEDAKTADMVLMPYSHNLARRHAPDLIELCVAEAKRQGKLLLIDGVGDIEYPITLPNTLVLRYGGYRFSRAGNEIIIPSYADDLLQVYCGGQLQMRKKSGKAIVGFSGWAALTPEQEMRALIKELPMRIKSIFNSRYGARKKGVFFRREAIDVLKRSSCVESHFLVRSSYSGHSKTATDTAEKLHTEFVDNVLGSDYALDVRGDANNSTRLFEILSLGRIPIIVDTERNFPFSDKIDYTSFSLVVDFRDIKQLPERIAEFHKNISPEQFEQMQRNARDAYVHYFRVDALMRPVMKELLAYLPQ